MKPNSRNMAIGGALAVLGGALASNGILPVWTGIGGGLAFIGGAFFAMRAFKGKEW